MRTLIGFALLVVTAFASWGLWLGEVIWLKGWAGLAWLSSFNWSSLPICVAIVTMSSYLVCTHARWPDRAKFIGLGSILTVSAFIAARGAAFDLFSQAMPGQSGLGAMIVLVGAALLVSVGLAASASRWLVPLYPWTWLLVGAGLMLVIPLSFFTIEVFPAINGSTDELHSIKMGYPVFWIALIVPVALRLGRRALR
jgi:hypothetical protein